MKRKQHLIRKHLFEKETSFETFETIIENETHLKPLKKKKKNINS